MGYFYPPPPSFVGGKQPYAPQLGIAQSGPVPQAPPLRGAIALATFGVILAGWQPPFFEPQGAGDIAPVLQVSGAASQPPVPCRVNLNTILRGWDPPFFMAQGGGDQAPTLPAPPVASQPPVTNRASQSIAISSWQIDSTTVIWTNAIGSQTIAAVQPPISSVAIQTIVQSWAQPYFQAQGAGDIAPSLPIISQPQPISWVQLNSIRATWDIPWSSAYMQGAGDIASALPAQGVPSQPPIQSGVNLQTIVQAWTAPAFVAQGAGDFAPTLPAAAASQPPVPSAVNFETILQSWVPAFMPPPRQQGVATQPIVNAPPINTDSLFYELISANQPPPYAIPKAATIASWLPPAGAPSQPQPISAVTLNLIVRAWDPPVWWPLPDNGPIAQTATVVNQPPVSSSAQLNALIATWQSPFVLPPTADDFAPLITLPAVPGPLPTLQTNLRLLLQSWDIGPTAIQPRAVVTASGPIPQAPPPSSRVILQTIVQLNQPPWSYGQGFGNIAVYPVYVPQIGGPRYVVRRLRSRRWTVSSVTYSQFDYKAPDEAIKLTFDFEPDLPTGVTLAGMPTVTITTNAGVDQPASLVGNGTAGPDPTNSQIIVPVAAGLDECDYKVHVRVATSDPLIILSLSGILPVRA